MKRKYNLNIIKFDDQNVFPRDLLPINFCGKKDILILFIPLNKFCYEKFKDILIFCKKFYSDVKFIPTDLNNYESLIELNKVNFFKPILYSIVQSIGYQNDLCLITFQIHNHDENENSYLLDIKSQIDLVAQYIKEQYFNLYIFVLNFSVIKGNISYKNLKHLFNIFFYLKTNAIKFNIINSDDIQTDECVNRSSTQHITIDID